MADKNNENSFDHFFKNKAKEYDIPFKESDWLELEKKLDLKEVQIAYKKKVRWIAAAAILIVSLLGYFTYENHNRLNQITQQIENEVSQPVEQSPSTVIDPILTLDDFRSDAEEVQDIEITEEFTRDATAEKDPMPHDSNELNDSESIQIDTPDEPFTILAETEDSYGSQYSEQLFRQGSIAKVSPEFFSSTVSIIPETAITAAEAATIRQKSASQPKFAIADVEIENGSPNQFTIGFVAGPDVSTVGSPSNFYDPGYKIGLMLEYDLSSKLSVSAGAVQSMVRYSTQSQNYNPPVYWTDGVTPDEMTGECLLVDIPINLKYNFLNFENSRFFATAGFSSYIMMNEEYSFRYDEYNSESIQNWSGRTGTRHWLSNASFSLGYELDIHHNWSLRAEPFMKTPIREVGWSNVKLFSAGSFFSLNYRL